MKNSSSFGRLKAVLDEGFDLTMKLEKKSVWSMTENDLDWFEEI